ncbi:PTS sugar transporter subunit IIC [Bacillus sp. SL00103]
MPQNDWLSWLVNGRSLHVAGFREKSFWRTYAVGIGTSKLRLNIVKNPLILIPPTIAGSFSRQLVSLALGWSHNAAGAGMGTSGLVGQLMTLTVMGFHPFF